MKRLFPLFLIVFLFSVLFTGCRTEPKVINVTKVTLDKTELSLTVGESYTLKENIEPENADNKKVTWTSSKEEVATVKDGKVTAIAKGAATITVTTADGEKTAVCTVTVEEPDTPVTPSPEDSAPETPEKPQPEEPAPETPEDPEPEEPADVVTFFWGEWTRMDNGTSFVVEEDSVKYNSRTYTINSTTETTLNVSGIGSFEKESDSVIVCNNIPYFRKGGTNLEYKLKVVGFNNSRAASTSGLSGIKGKGKSNVYKSFRSEAESDANGEITFTAPTLNDIQTVTIENNGNDVVVSNLKIQNSGDFMGTVALVEPGQFNLKISGTIDESQKHSGYLYGNNAKEYEMKIVVENVSDVDIRYISLAVDADDPNLTVTSSADLTGYYIPTMHKGATTKDTPLKVSVKYGKLDDIYVDTGLKVTMSTAESDLVWEDYIPLRFYKGTMPVSIATSTSLPNSTAALNGFIIYPDGNSQFFNISNNKSKTLYVPIFESDKAYRLVFSGATTSLSLSKSTEMFYTVVAGSKTAVPVVTSGSGLNEYYLFGGNNHSEVTAYEVNDSFEAYLSEGEIDYYTIKANIGNTYYLPTGTGYHTVSYTSEFGTVAEDITVANGTKLSADKLPVLEADGMTFDGWYDGETKVEAGSYTVNDSVTLTAKWIFDIMYNLDGGSNSESNPYTYVIEDTITFENPTRTGYVFDGWYDNADFEGTTITGYEKGTSGAKTLYAKWSIITYTITYNLDGGTNSESNVSSYDVKTTVNLESPEKSDYTFMGWYENSSFTGKSVNKYTSGTTGDKTLYAKWTATNYTITYNLNGGINAASNVSRYTVNDAVTLANPTRTGYAFAGWYDNEEFTGTAVTGYEAGTGGAKTLYAKWTPVSYTITYMLDDNGTNAASNPATYTVEDEITLAAAASDDYVFDGWFTNSSYSGIQTAVIEEGTHGDITLYARWAEKRNVTYVSAHGTQPESIVVAEGTVLSTVQLASLTDAAYLFMGWYSDEEYTAQAIADTYTVSGGDVTLYAKWLKRCTITYVTTYGSVEAKEVLENTSLTEDYLPPLVKKGYVLQGWYTETEHENKITTGYAITDDMTLYAFWEEVVFVEGGTYTMGYSPDGNSNTEHSVTVSDFFMSPYEMTQKIYTEVMGTNPSGFSSSPDFGEVQEERPVEWVSWYDAIYFCNKYSEANGFTPCYKVNGSTDVTAWGYTPHNGNSISGTITCDFTADGYRLPTEAEWEYAAKGGNNYSSLYSGSNTAGDVAWYGGNAGSKTHQVGLKAANRLGLYDMSGNVTEWCWDWFGSYTSVTQTNPAGASSSDSGRVIRGGSWGGNAINVRCADRGRDNPYSGRDSIGFRLVRSSSN